MTPVWSELLLITHLLFVVGTDRVVSYTVTRSSHSVPTGAHTVKHTYYWLRHLRYLLYSTSLY